MLETRTPISNRTRRLDAPPRPASSAARSAARADSAARESPAAPGRAVVGNTALDTAPARPLPRSVPAPRPSRLGRSEMRLMGLATTCTAIVCGLLLLYLAAYAHVSQLGYDQAEARVQLRQNQLRNESLRAERDRLQSRRYVIGKAIALGMTPPGTTPIRYITARPPRIGRMEQTGRDARPKTDRSGAGNAETVADGEQGINGGTTADSSKQPSFDH